MERRDHDRGAGRSVLSSAAPAERSARSRRAGWGLLLPTWAILAGCLLLPLALLFLTSFRERGPYGDLRPIADLVEYVRSGAFLGNYLQALEPVYRGIYWRSLRMALATTALCLAIGYPTAYFIARVAPPRWKGVLLALVVIPFWTSFLIRTYAWMFILRSQGLANALLLELGWIDRPLELLFTETAVAIGLVYGELPFMILPLYASLEKLDPALLEAAADLGAGAGAAFWRVTVPLTAPGIAAGVVLVFVPSLGQFVVPDLLGGAKSMLVGNLIQNQFTVARNRPFGSALAFELTAVVLALLAAYALYTRRRGREVLL